MTNPEKTYGIFDKPINRKIINQIKSNGNDVFKISQVKNTELNFTITENEILSDLSKIDWIMFTDVFSVEYFISKLEDSKIDLFELDNLRVCAYGEAVADRLRFVQVHSDVIANKLVDKDIFQHIKDYLFDENELVDLNVLLIKEKSKDFEIEKILNTSKTNVTNLEVYQSLKVENVSKIKTLTKSGAFDEFLFTSVDDVFELLNLFYPEPLSSMLQDIAVSATDENTFQTLLEIGFQPNYFK